MRKGFFSLKEERELTTSRANRKIRGCVSCKLNKQCLSPKLLATGKGKKKILVLGEAQGEKEDKRAKQWIGKSGQLLRKILKSNGIDLDNDCRKINAICCHPPDNRDPKQLEIDCCRPNILNEIEEFKPQLILAFGRFAVECLTGHRIKQGVGSIGKWRGWAIPDSDFNCWICPTYHPSFINRNEHNPAAELIIKKDVKNALSLLKKPLPKYKEDIIVCHSWQEANRLLRNTIKTAPSIVAFDYETTGLKPHARGHQIVSCAISWQDCTFAFLNHRRTAPLLKEFVTNTKIKKIAANIKFEELWTREILGVHVEEWLWDTMLAAHCLDNRRQITGLKFQVYARYALNRILELVKKDPASLLEYNGMDALLEYRLALDQMKEMGIIDPFTFAKKGVSNWEGEPSY